MSLNKTIENAPSNEPLSGAEIIEFREAIGAVSDNDARLEDNAKTNATNTFTESQTIQGGLTQQGDHFNLLGEDGTVAIISEELLIKGAWGFDSPNEVRENLGGVADNDSRLSNSREWTADTIDQAEAEAGTSTTRRAFTAQRVRQAIVAWFAAIRVALTKIEDMPTDRLLGRNTAGSGVVETLEPSTVKTMLSLPSNTVSELNGKLSSEDFSQANILTLINNAALQNKRAKVVTSGGFGITEIDANKLYIFSDSSVVAIQDVSSLLQDTEWEFILATDNDGTLDFDFKDEAYFYSVQGQAMAIDANVTQGVYRLDTANNAIGCTLRFDFDLQQFFLIGQFIVAP